jgi:outer membrane protein assembly factor BamB
MVFTGSDINIVTGDDPPLDSPAYDYWYAPENSFGIQETKTVNWSYWKSWLKDNFHWQLQGSPNGNVWYNDTLGLMEVGIDWNEINNTAKVTLTLNTTNAPQSLYYRFELGCNASLKSYINKSSNYEYTLTLPANLTEDYNLSFNFSDVKPLITSGKVTVKHGIKNIDGNNYFGFRVQTVNKIDVGKVFVVDPTFTVHSSSLYGYLRYPANRKVVRDSNGNLFCIFGTSTPYTIYAANSSDLGATWTSTVIADGTTYNQHYGALAVDSNDVVHAVWHGFHSGQATYRQIRYCNNSGGTTTWGEPVNLTDDSSYNQHYPSLAIDSNDNLHVVWSAGGKGTSVDEQVSYINSTDVGSTWSGIQVLTDEANDGDDMWYPSIAINSTDSVHVVYMCEDYANGYDQILHQESDDGGISWSTWTSDAITSDSSYNQKNPCLAIDDNDVLHVSWYGDNQNTKDQVGYSYNDGSWSVVEWLTTDTVYDQGLYGPTISITDNDYVYVIWHGKHAGSTLYTQIRYICHDTNSWSQVYNITSDSANNNYANCICSQTPTIGGNKVCRAKTGFALVYLNDTTTANHLTYYASSDLTWDTGVANTAPTQSAQKIWNSTTSVEKSLNATGVSPTPTCFNVTIADIDADQMNVTIKTNESSTWTIVNQTSSGMSNDTYHGYNTSWIDACSTKYWISFNVSDGTEWCNETFNFTTTNPPTVTTFNVDQDDGGSNLWDLDNNDIQIDYDLDDVDGGALTAYITYKFSSSPTDPSSSNYDAQITSITSPWSANDVDLNWRNDGHSDNHAVNSDVAWVDTTNDVYIKIIAYDGTSYSSANEDTTDRPVGIDGTNPTGTIDIYDDTENPTSIEGDTADITSGVASNDIQIYDNDDSDYWTGSTWGGQTWLDCSGTTSWSYDSSGVPWDSTHNITITLRAYDNAGNVDSNVDTEYFTTNAFPTVTNPVPANDSSGQSLTPTLSVDVGDLDLGTGGEGHANWDQYCGDNNLTGYQSDCDFSPINNTLLWNFATGGTSDEYCGAMVHDGIVYVGVKGDDKLYAIYLNNGTKIWDYTIDEIDDVPLYHDGKIYVIESGQEIGVDYRDELYCFNETTSSIADLYWNVTLSNNPDDGAGSPLYDPDDDSIIVNCEGSVWSVYPENGTVKWQTAAYGTTLESSPSYYNGLVYSLHDAATAVARCWYSSNGTLKWSVDCGGLSFWDSSPLIVPEYSTLYVCPRDGTNDIMCLNLTTGAYIWNMTALVGNDCLVTPAYHNGKIFLGKSDADTFYCVNASISAMDDATRKIWENTAPAGDIYSSPIVANGYVYFGCNDNNIYCLWENNGTTKWTYDTGGSVLGQTCIADGILVYNTDNSKVVALGDLSQYNDTLGTDTLDTSWWYNDSGNWYNFGNNNSLYFNQTICQPFPNATSYGTTYYWSVNVTDGTSWTNRTYHFTTTSVFIWIDITNARLSLIWITVPSTQTSNCR